jgi:hypothetical protein
MHVHHDVRPRAFETGDRPREWLPSRAEAARQIAAALAAPIAALHRDHVTLDLHPFSSAAGDSSAYSMSF